MEEKSKSLVPPGGWQPGKLPILRATVTKLSGGGDQIIVRVSVVYTNYDSYEIGWEYATKSSQSELEQTLQTARTEARRTQQDIVSQYKEFVASFKRPNPKGRDERIFNTNTSLGRASKSMNSPLTSVKGYRELDDGTLIVPVIGVPYKEPEYLGERDFQGDYFSPRTNTGPLKQVLSYFDHNKGMFDPRLAKYPDFADEPVGIAERREKTEEGELFDIIIDRAYKYKNLIKKLIDAHALKVSTTPFQRSVRRDKSTGHLDRWEIVELGLVIEAASPNADIVYKSLEETFGKEFEMAEETKQPEVEVIETIDLSADETSLSVTEQVQKTMQAGENEKSLPELLVELQKSIAGLQASMDARFGKLEADVVDLQTAVPLIGKEAAKHFRLTMQEDQQKSTTERQQEQAVRQQMRSKLPDSAPGRDRRMSS